MHPQLLRLLLTVLNRARARGPGVLVTLAVLVTTFGVAAFEHEAHTVGNDMSWHESLYWTFGLFTFAGNPLDYPHTLPLQVVYFAAPMISASALLGALLHLLEERAPLLVRRFKGHTVVGGLGNLGITLTRDLQKRGRAFVGIERNEEAPEVGSLRAAGAAVVVVGDITSAEVLRRAGCHRAARVFFTTPNDVANLDAAFNVRRIARLAGAHPPPTVFAHVYDVALGDALVHQLKEHDVGDARIVPFNSYRIAAKALIAGLLRDRVVRSLRVAPGFALVRTAWPEDDPGLRRGVISLDEDRRRLLRAFRLEREAATEAGDCYAIVGLGRFGRSVLREMLASVPVPTRFLIVERTQLAYDASAESFPPEDRVRFDVCIADATSATAINRIHDSRPSAVLVCTDNDISNLRLALVLHRRSVKTVTRMFDLEASAELSRGLDERGISPVGLARLFRTAIPFLTHERQLIACVNVDVGSTAHGDHLFYVARVTPDERQRLGRAFVSLAEFESSPDVPEGSTDLGLVWHGNVSDLTRRVGEHPITNVIT